MKQDPIEKLHTLGVVLAVFAGLLVLLMVLTVQTVATLDEHTAQHAGDIEKSLQRQ